MLDKDKHNTSLPIDALGITNAGFNSHVYLLFGYLSRFWKVAADEIIPVLTCISIILKINLGDRKCFFGLNYYI